MATRAAQGALRLFDPDDDTLDAHIARIVHDLKQPLTTLAVSLDMLALSAPSSPHVRRCQRAIRRQRELLDDLQTLTSRLDLADAIDLEALIVDIIDDAQPAAARRRVELFFQAKTTATLAGNRLALGRALSNVVGNAIDLTPAGSRVDVVLERKRGRACIDVRDQGPGLARDLRERAFEPFFTMRRGGTGLGLAIARAAAEAHHGTVRFVAAAGGCVRFELPCARRRVDGRARAALVVSAGPRGD